MEEMKMKFEPMIKVMLHEYQKSYGKMNVSEDEAFEYFVNHTILRSHQPEAFSVINDICDLICVDGQNDMGIDGIAIKVNDIFISTKEDIDSFISMYRKIKIEFIFIQSKYKEKFDSGEYGKFVDGIADFLQMEHSEPHNEKIKYWIELKDYLLSEEIMTTWQDIPNIRLYYVVMGKWNNNEHIIAKTENLKRNIELMKTYGDVIERYIDSSALLKMCEENDNNFSAVLNTIDSFQLTEVQKVDNSIIMMCNAKEIIKMLQSGDELLRKSLFTDNVRDFQGDTTINREILETVKKNPQQFVLMNNGITIVCNKAISSNRKVTITCPQVVNGCQTCNVLYSAFKQGCDLDEVVVTVKVIATQKSEITNQIVRGTNRQNIVLDEAFEITRDFHKNLENFFLSMPSNGEEYEKVYYERRSKQYADNPTILATQKINFRLLIQSVVSIFLQKPCQAYMHEAKLLQEFQNILFVDNQSLFPYYVAPCLLLKMDEVCRERDDRKFCATYKYQILFVTAIKIAGFPPDINKENLIDTYCKKVMEIFLEKVRLEQEIDNAIRCFNRIVSDWVKEKGSSYYHGVKSNQDFNDYLIKALHISEKDVIDKKHKNPTIDEYRGTVLKVLLDKKNQYYGFISRLPDNIFFHKNDNLKLDFSSLYARDVIYIIKKDIRGNERAVITKVI